MFPFKAALNTSTLFPFSLNVIEQIKMAAEAGYDGIELWMRDIEAFIENGGSVQELKNALHDANVELVNVIAFFKWADADLSVREEGFAQATREMKLLADIGCRYIAAPPFGDVASVELEDMADSFQQLVSLGEEIGVEPVLEFWGKALKLSTLPEAIHVLKESKVENGKLLLDPFHMHVGGSDFATIQQLTGEQIGVFHVNDYPHAENIESLVDADRVFPGEGVSPTKEIAQTLHNIGYKGYLSLELFIENFEGKSALEVATYGLNAMKKAYSI
ncbi:MAG TPA: sugar phosphate isomerase/epimerase family protein [Bacillaceae bacterium]|nr:sugar phosphate isomerase/epimerase family protein [Paenibacillus bovis]HLU21425.1 sugar phosphate isomerase/epimerase family protein [Bacillaceae bacterium]